jgi:thiamine biosynthesis lipoprotein
MEELEFEAMNTNFYAGVSNCAIPNWKEDIHNWFAYVEREWSRFRKENELAKINSLALGEKLQIHPLLLDILQKADSLREKTRGYFNPYLKKYMEHNGYDRSFPFQTACVTEKKELEAPCYENPFLFDKEKSTICRIRNGEIDLGGIGKGYAVETAAQWLKKTGNAAFGIVDGGGDMTVWSDGSKLWRIGIAHPLEPEKEIGQFSLYNGSVATSNRLYRCWNDGDVVKHHILNGHTGMPVHSHIIQATVITANLLDAEAVAKLSFMVSKSELEKYASEINREIQYVLITENGEVIKGWDIYE